MEIYLKGEWDGWIIDPVMHGLKIIGPGCGELEITQNNFNTVTIIEKDELDDKDQTRISGAEFRKVHKFRREMIDAGVPSEHAAVAAEMAAEYASKAYTHGYDQGFIGGIDRQKARMPNDEVSDELSPKDKTQWHKDSGTNKTGFLGVKYSKRNKCYEAYIRHPERGKVYCGMGKTPDEAAKKYDEKAREFFGADAVTNFPST